MLTWAAGLRVAAFRLKRTAAPRARRRRALRHRHVVARGAAPEDQVVATLQDARHGRCPAPQVVVIEANASCLGAAAPRRGGGAAKAGGAAAADSTL